MGRSTKFRTFASNGMKKMQVIGSKGAKFAKDQMNHPAAKKFAMDAVKIGAISGMNPKVAGPMLAARAEQEIPDIASRTINRHM